jgi:hypothetical protein
MITTIFEGGGSGDDVHDSVGVHDDDEDGVVGEMAVCYFLPHYLPRRHIEQQHVAVTT